MARANQSCRCSTTGRGCLPRQFRCLHRDEKGDLLVGNFGNGRILAFDPANLNGQDEFQHRGPLHSADGPPIEIDGLWALAFGSGSPASGPTNTLFFTAGPFDEQHGLFGTLVVAPSPRRVMPATTSAKEHHDGAPGHRRRM